MNFYSVKIRYLTLFLPIPQDITKLQNKYRDFETYMLLFTSELVFSTLKKPTF